MGTKSVLKINDWFNSEEIMKWELGVWLKYKYTLKTLNVRRTAFKFKVVYIELMSRSLAKTASSVWAESEDFIVPRHYQSLVPEVTFKQTNVIAPDTTSVVDPDTTSAVLRILLFLASWIRK